MAALIEAARAGSQTAFSDLVSLHQRVLFRTALAALGSREDAEDATQDAFVTAWQKLSGFRGDATFRTWLLTIVWRKALDRRRVRRLWWNRTQPLAWSDDGPDPIELVATGEPNPEQQALANDLSRIVRTEIAHLAPKLRDTLLLTTSGEYAYDEIAAMLGIPVGTVKWRVSEARRVLNMRLDRTVKQP
jgi:RNA polymerase sigma-70 factor (ECF subfamily)